MSVNALKGIPAELRELPRWVCWRTEERPDGKGEMKPTKVPRRADGRANASSTNAKTWSDLAGALAGLELTKADGIGFVFSADDDLVGIDLDHCRDPQTGAIDAGAQKIIDAFATYTEASVSGTGVHLILRGRLPKGARNRRQLGKLGVEVYDRGRYFCMTGAALNGTAVRDCQEQLERLCAHITPTKQGPAAPPAGRPPLQLSDEQLLAKARDSAAGPCFDALWRGDTSGYDGDHSRADMALLTRLAFWTNCDAGQIDRLFRSSGLMREKWEREDYREASIGKACELVAKAGGGYTGTGRDAGQVEKRETKTDAGTPATVPASGVSGPEEPPASPLGPTKPRPLGPAAYHGPLGAFVKAWEPHTEADPAALLATTIVGFSSIVGAGPRHTISGDEHTARLWACVVGASSAARKGMSYKPARSMLAKVDPGWGSRCTASGLSTGEGLIHHVRDRVLGTVTDKKTGEQREIVEDAGVEDKRLFLLEAEFARVLTVMARKDNTLSAVARGLWDSGEAGVMTRSAPATTHGAHVCIIAHITIEELRRALSDCDAANGFANRFLWVYAERHGSLPFGGQADPKEVEIVRGQLARAFLHAPEGEIPWSSEARTLWAERYDGLLRAGGGITGSIIARGQPQVLRLALVYALADDALEIGRVHLEAALEVWRYCSESARYIFGERTGDRDADRILAELRERGTMTRNDIRELFDRHKTSTAIAAALETLKDAGLAESTKAEPAGGRPAEVWRPC